MHPREPSLFFPSFFFFLSSFFVPLDPALVHRKEISTPATAMYPRFIPVRTRRANPMTDNNPLPTPPPPVCDLGPSIGRSPARSFLKIFKSSQNATLRGPMEAQIRAAAASDPAVSLAAPASPLLHHQPHCPPPPPPQRPGDPDPGSGSPAVSVLAVGDGRTAPRAALRSSTAAAARPPNNNERREDSDGFAMPRPTRLA